MKISETHPGAIPNSTVRTPEKAGSSGESFQRIMEQVTHQEGAKTGPLGGAGAVLPGQGVEIAPPIGKVEPTQASEQQARIVQVLEETLDTVDAYAAALRNGSVSASDLKPLAEHLGARLEGLQQLEKDPELPEGLRTVISDLSLTIGTEMARFGRGDYE